MNLDQLFDKARNLPVLPRVLQELLTSFNAPELRTDVLAQLVASDPAICARLLRLANSANYQMPQTIGSAHQAVQLLGLNNVRSLVISMGLISCFVRLPTDFLKPFWQHSLRTAALARRWAAPAQVDAELAYTLGLLRCIGQLLLRQVEAAPMLALDAQTDAFAPTRLATERVALGYNYADVGAQLARRWQFPALFAEVIDAINIRPKNPQTAQLADLLALAAWQAWASTQGFEAEQLDALWPSDLAQRVGVSAQQGGSHLGDWAAQCDDLQTLLTQT